MHCFVLVADDRNIYDALDRYTIHENETSGPDACFDYYSLTDNKKCMLILSRPRIKQRLFGLLPSKKITRVPAAKKNEIDQEALLANPPVAIFYNDQLRECEYSDDDEQYNKWKEEFGKIFQTIPDSMTLQMVDAHG